MHEVLKTAFDDNSMGTTEDFCVVFLFQTWGRFSLKIVSIQVNPSTGCAVKTWRMFTKSSAKTDEIPLWRSLVGKDSCMEHISEF
jgi:hypothetical protein